MESKVVRCIAKIAWEIRHSGGSSPVTFQSELTSGQVRLQTLQEGDQSGEFSRLPFVFMSCALCLDPSSGEFDTANCRHT